MQRCFTVFWAVSQSVTLALRKRTYDLQIPGLDADVPQNAEEAQAAALARSPVTATGKVEAETSAGRHNLLPARLSLITTTPRPCLDPCHPAEICWNGQCIYRPWQTSFTDRKSCYSNWRLPGIENYEKQACRSASAVYSEDMCTRTAYFCMWSSDAPYWWRSAQGHAQLKQREYPEGPRQDVQGEFAASPDGVQRQMQSRVVNPSIDVGGAWAYERTYQPNLEPIFSRPVSSPEDHSTHGINWGNPLR